LGSHKVDALLRFFVFLSVPSKNVHNSSFKNQYSPQITLSDEHRMHKKYAIEDIKKGRIKSPEQIYTHRNK
jgi:hypothetical protein